MKSWAARTVRRSLLIHHTSPSQYLSVWSEVRALAARCVKNILPGIGLNSESRHLIVAS